VSCIPDESGNSLKERPANAGEEGGWIIEIMRDYPSLLQNTPVKIFRAVPVTLFLLQIGAADAVSLRGAVPP